MNNEYDVIIIGGGIAGLTAAIYTARAGLKTVILEKGVLGGQIVNASLICNYPGIDSISGADLIEKVFRQVKKLNVEIKYENVISCNNHNVTTDNNSYDTKTIIIACGLKHNSLPMFDEFVGKGVSFCATCDGFFYKNKDVAVVGGGSTALSEALYLSNIANNVYLIHRRNSFRADEYLINEIKKVSNIKPLMCNTIKSIVGSEKLDKLILDNDDELRVSCLFVAIGNKADVENFSNVVILSSDGFIEKSKYENIFCAGDVLKDSQKQLIIAAGSGAKAALSLIEYFRKR